MKIEPRNVAFQIGVYRVLMSLCHGCNGHDASWGYDTDGWFTVWTPLCQVSVCRTRP